jgi:hypothetical protein
MSNPESNPGKHLTIIFDKHVTNVGGHYNHYAGIFIVYIVDLLHLWKW